MMNRFFGRNENVEELIAGLESRIDEQNRSLVVTGTAVIELEKVIENMRLYNEGMEVRIRKQNESFAERVEKEIDSAVQSILTEVKSLGKLAGPKEVAKAIDNKTREQKKDRLYRVIKRNLNDITAKYLIHDLPLVSKGIYKVETMTPSGDAVYEAVCKFIVDMAKVSGVKKENFTNRSKYDAFFKHYGIKPYNRISLRRKDGTQLNTLLGAVIKNGHIRQYIEYLIRTLEDERRKLV